MKELRIPFTEFVEKEYGKDHVIIACGLPATNKTETMEVVSRLKDYRILRTDMIRKEVQKGEDIFDEKVAADMGKRQAVYDVMFHLADRIASEGHGVILDATFVTQLLRLRAAEVAYKNGKVLVIQQTKAPEEYSLEKISKRTKENYESNALTPDAYYNNVKKWEEVDLDALRTAYEGLRVRHVVVDTGSDEEQEWVVVGEDVRD